MVRSFSSVKHGLSMPPKLTHLYTCEFDPVCKYSFTATGPPPNRTSQELLKHKQDTIDHLPATVSKESTNAVNKRNLLDLHETAWIQIFTVELSRCDLQRFNCVLAFLNYIRTLHSSPSRNMALGRDVFICMSDLAKEMIQLLYSCGLGADPQSQPSEVRRLRYQQLLQVASVFRDQGLSVFPGAPVTVDNQESVVCPSPTTTSVETPSLSIPTESTSILPAIQPAAVSSVQSSSSPDGMTDFYQEQDDGGPSASSSSSGLLPQLRKSLRERRNTARMTQYLSDQRKQQQPAQDQSAEETEADASELSVQEFTDNRTQLDADLHDNDPEQLQPSDDVDVLHFAKVFDDDIPVPVTTDELADVNLEAGTWEVALKRVRDAKDRSDAVHVARQCFHQINMLAELSQPQQELVAGSFKAIHDTCVEMFHPAPDHATKFIMESKAIRDMEACSRLTSNRKLRTFREAICPAVDCKFPNALPLTATELEAFRKYLAATTPKTTDNSTHVSQSATTAVSNNAHSNDSTPVAVGNNSAPASAINNVPSSASTGQSNSNSTHGASTTSTSSATASNNTAPTSSAAGATSSTVAEAHERARNWLAFAKCQVTSSASSQQDAAAPAPPSLSNMAIPTDNVAEFLCCKCRAPLTKPGRDNKAVELETFARTLIRENIECFAEEPRFVSWIEAFFKDIPPLDAAKEGQ